MQTGVTLHIPLGRILMRGLTHHLRENMINSVVVIGQRSVLKGICYMTNDKPVPVSPRVHTPWDVIPSDPTSLVGNFILQVMRPIGNGATNQLSDLGGHLSSVGSSFLLMKGEGQRQNWDTSLLNWLGPVLSCVHHGQGTSFNWSHEASAPSFQDKTRL